MELDPASHQPSPVEPLDFLESQPYGRRIGPTFPLEKFGEIYFAANRRIQGSTSRGDPYLHRTPGKEYPSLHAKDTTLPAECHFKKLAAGLFSSGYNDHDDLFGWTGESRPGQEGPRTRDGESQDHTHKSNGGCLDGITATDDTDFKRKMPEPDNQPHDAERATKRTKKQRGKEGEDQRTPAQRKEEIGGSKMPPWHIDVIEDMTADLDGSLSNLGADLGTGPYSMSEALLSLPSLTVFKQEAPSPSQDNLVHMSQANAGSGAEDQVQDNPSALHRLLQHNSVGNHNGGNNSGSAKRITCHALNKHAEMPEKKADDCRFQYVLAAATSIATKVTEETLTYLNQGQSYEIKLKKVGELSNFRGKILKSIIRICFHERRLQYMEKEQIYAWQASRPGERIVELDVPLSYGLFDIDQDPNALNALSFLWDPTKEVGAYIKVNCISTEFTPKKHGGEKGVPFRIQVETFIEGETTRLHAAACQIKVFKLKGADRKHKQDREKILKRPLSEQDKYQPSYECTVLNDLLPEAVFPSTCCSSSPTSTVCGRGNSGHAMLDSGDSNFLCHGQLRSQVNSPVRTDGNVNGDSNGDKRRSPVSLPPTDTGPTGQISNLKLSPEFTSQQTAQWLRKNGFGNYVSTFGNFTGADILRLTRDDLIQICGLPDGIRLLYAVHSKAIVRLTLYVCVPGSPVYHALYLDHVGRIELSRKLAAILAVYQNQIHEVFLQGPNDIKVLMTDEVVAHIKDESMFSIEVLKDETRNRFALLLKPTGSQ